MICSQSVRLQNLPLFYFTDKVYGFTQFPLQEKVLECSMMFLRSLSPTSFSKEPHHGVIHVFHELVKRFTIPQVESKQNAISDLCGIVNDLGALEDNRLKKNHPISVTLPSKDPVKFYRQDSHKSLPNFPGRCVIALGRHTNKFFHRVCHLMSSDITPSNW